jgi:hypothetical protein
MYDFMFARWFVMQSAICTFVREMIQCFFHPAHITVSFYHLIDLSTFIAVHCNTEIIFGRPFQQKRAIGCRCEDGVSDRSGDGEWRRRANTIFLISAVGHTRCSRNITKFSEAIS